MDPTISAWEYFQGPFNYDVTHLWPLGFNEITQNKTSTRNLWDYCGDAAWNIGVSLKHYCYQNIVSKSTKAMQISDTIKLIHHHLTLPLITPEDHITQGINKLICALQDAPNILCNNQLIAVESLRKAFHQWSGANVQRQAPISPPSLPIPQPQRTPITRPPRHINHQTLPTAPYP